MRLYLASKSECRKRLLERAGYDVVVVESEYEEPPPFPPASFYVMEMARRKASSGEEKAAQMGGEIILAADTVVECDGEILGKPKDGEEAKTILKKCSGKKQRVWTGVCVMSVKTGVYVCEVDSAVVRMESVSDADIEKIIKGGRSLGKAGAYAVREDGEDEFVELLEGSLDTVVGLPLELVGLLLSQLGV